MVLYHGSNMEVAKPRLIGQKRGLDYGAGFYLTTNHDQAKRFSEIIVNRQKNGVPTVSIYEFDMEKANQSLNILRFAQADGKWLEFVKDNRLKQYSGMDYDMVVGPVANDDVMPTIQGYLSGFLSVEATLLTLKTRKLTDQICLKSERTVTLLKFMGSEVAK